MSNIEKISEQSVLSRHSRVSNASLYKPAYSTARRMIRRVLGVRPRVHFSPSTLHREVVHILEGLSSRVPFFYFVTELRVRRNVLELPDSSDEVLEVVYEAAKRWRHMSSAQKRPYRIFALREKQRQAKRAREQARERAREKARQRSRDRSRERAYEREHEQWVAAQQLEDMGRRGFNHLDSDSD